MSPNSGTMSQTGSNVVTIFWTSAGAKWVSVNYTDANGCSAASATVYNVTVNPLPGTPGSIIGQSSICAGTGNISYSVAAVANATNYIWTLPAGASIATGAGTNAITVNYSSTAVSGDISVLANNSCGDGQPSPPFAVTVNNTPAAAGVIAGANEVCQGSTGISYSVGAITGATSYSWNLPIGATIVSGANTNSITVDYSLNAVSGLITVSGVNACGTGTASVITVSVNVKPATPVITLNGNTLSSNAASGNQWYLDGNILAGATSPTYTVLQDGTYTVVVSLDGCNSDVSNSIVIIHTAAGDKNAVDVSIYPNPNEGVFWLTINTKVAETYSFRVINSTGNIVHQVNKLEVNGMFKQYFDLEWLSAGMYTLVLSSDSEQIIKKFVVY
jgi:hypothetical protein